MCEINNVGYKYELNGFEYSLRKQFLFKDRTVKKSFIMEQ